MSEYEEDEYCGADYETLDQWTARHIEEGREKWGHGNCFDWLNPGAHCFGCHYNHPQLTLAVTGFASDYEGPGANRRGNAAPAPAAEEDDDASDWSSSAEAPAPAPLDDDDDVSIVSVSSATAEDASERLERAEGYAERYPAKAAKALRPCITAWRGGAPIDFASNPDAGPVLAVSCCYAYARATANVAVQDGACGENSPALVADALEALDQALELDPAHAPSTRLRGRLLPLLGEALCPRKIRSSFQPNE